MAASAISDETFAAPEPATHVTRTRSRSPAAVGWCYAGPPGLSPEDLSVAFNATITPMPAARPTTS